jgi:hypothetical protein
MMGRAFHGSLNVQRPYRIEDYQEPPQGSARKNYTVKTLIGNPTEFEIESFNSIQEAWDGNTFLYHFDPNLRLYADIDAFKEWGFGVQIYHIESDQGEALNHTLKAYRTRSCLHNMDRTEDPSPHRKI